ncbi:MAG: hypothetical protein RLZZ379_1399, partial [Pseudomonadota bacterium]
FDYVIRVLNAPEEVNAVEWNELLYSNSQASPFMRHEYLLALHTSGSAVPETGWTPKFILLERSGNLVGACALYIKSHSYGEYVFDWAWADAYQRSGLNYYPKLLAAIPFTPITSPRLLAKNNEIKNLMMAALGETMLKHKLSSVHVIFPDDDSALALLQDGWMQRHGVQFRWENEGFHGYNGYAWYRKHFSISQKYRNRTIHIGFFLSML